MRSAQTYRENSDLPLIAEGDENAFYRFYTHHANLLRPFLLKYTRSKSDAEDIIQETFIRVWLNRDRLPGIENIAGWVYRIASRVYLDHVEREMKRRRQRTAASESLSHTGPGISSERTRWMEINHLVQQALNALPEQKRKVYYLNRELDMKPAQIAAHLNMPVGTVKNQLSAALGEIRKQLIEHGYDHLIFLYGMCIFSSF